MKIILLSTAGTEFGISMILSDSLDKRCKTRFRKNKYEGFQIEA